MGEREGRKKGREGERKGVRGKEKSRDQLRKEMQGKMKATHNQDYIRAKCIYFALSFAIHAKSSGSSLRSNTELSVQSQLRHLILQLG